MTVVLSVTSGFEVTDKPYVQDEGYYASSRTLKTTPVPTPPPVVTPPPSQSNISVTSPFLVVDPPYVQDEGYYAVGV